MENSLKGLILASGVVITCIIVSLGFFISREAKNAANDGINQIFSMSSTTDVSKDIYDGLHVSGSEVVELIERSYNELSDGSLLITVITGKRSDTKKTVEFNSLAVDAASAKVYSGERYINPNGIFAGEVTTDAKGLINMTFTQL